MEQFATFCIGTAEFFVKLYPWYPMPPSVHKVLIHGPQIIKACFLPIGQMSEEAQESSNKIFKRARLINSRMCSRLANNEDVIHNLLLSSDPIISALRKKEKSKDEKSVTAEDSILVYL